MIIQKTLTKSLNFEGLGLHTNTFSKLNLCPSSENTGINILIKNKLYSINEFERETNFCTILKKNEIIIMTTEHLFSAIYSLGITNIIIELDGIEVPILDGSSKLFVDILKSNIKEQNNNLKKLNINNSFIFSKDNKFISYFPNNRLEIIYIIDYPNTEIDFQIYKYTHSENNYINDISFCRTFGFYEDLEYLRKNKLAHYSNLENSLVIKNKKYLNKERIKNEAVRHKILDILGDMIFINNYPNILIIAYKTGHKEHKILVDNIILNI